MKTSFKYFALTTFAILLCSCNKEITPDTIESQVQISARITPCIVTRVTDDGTAFSDGDAIEVQNVDRESKNLATYTYTASTGKWSTTDELYWDGESENTFNAWYPTTAQYNSFTIPSDQSTGITNADWMTATSSAKKADGNVALSFNHNLAKVTVTIEAWSNEYTANEKVVNSLELNSLSSTLSNSGTLSGDGVAKWIKTYVSQANTSFVAIVAPGTYASDVDIMQVYVNGSATALNVKTSSAVVIESGKAYSFKLTIGKDLATISSSVTVGEWDDEALENQNASAIVENYEYIDEYGESHGDGVEIDGVVWAPVNCGYHSDDYPYGKLYQWGRKYGQGYGDNEPTFVNGPVSVEIGESEDNSNVFYLVDNYTLHWDSSNNYELWPSENYDPCPHGWRVPTKTELGNLGANYSLQSSYNGQNGYWLSGSNTYDSNVPQLFLPAAGYRTAYGTGSLYSQNEVGIYASSTGSPYNENVWILEVRCNADEGEEVGTDRYEACNGYSVRCVKE